MLEAAKLCPACSVTKHMFPVLNHEDIKFLSTHLNSCPIFNSLTPEAMASMIELHKGCSLCTLYAHQRDTCYQKRNKKTVWMCQKLTGNKVCRREHDLALHGGQDPPPSSPS